MSMENSIKLIETKTRDLCIDVLRSLNEAEDCNWMPSPAVMLIILSGVGAALATAIKADTQRIGEIENTDEEKAAEYDMMIDTCVQTCFSIMSEALPIEIHGTTKLRKEDAGKVFDFVEGLVAKPDGKEQH